MPKASRCYTGSRQSVGTPALNRNQFMQQIKLIRKARQEHPPTVTPAKGKTDCNV